VQVHYNWAGNCHSATADKHSLLLPSLLLPPITASTPREPAKLRTVASAASYIHGPLPLLLSWHRSGGQYRADSIFRPYTGQIIVAISISQAPVTGQGRDFGKCQLDFAVRSFPATAAAVVVVAAAGECVAA